MAAARPEPPPARGRWSPLGRIDVLGPLLVVAIVFAFAVGTRLDKYHGNITGFVLFGRHFVKYTHPPRGASINTPGGYDGQFFWIQANDPLLLDDATVARMRGARAGFRLQRMAYPALAYVLAAGQRSVIPWTLLAINVLAVLAITGGFALYARRRGCSGWWALAVGLMSGFLAATLRDLSDPLAAACMLGGLLMWRRERPVWTAGLLTVAVLAREPMMLAVAAVGLDAGARCWRARGVPGALGAAVRNAWPAVVVPVAAFLAWQAYVDARYGGNAAATSLGFLPPFEGYRDEAHHAHLALSHGSTLNGLWDFGYLGLMLAGTAVAVALVRRQLSAVSIAALLFGLSLLVLVFGDEWSYTRLSAPLFAALLLAGLEQRARFALLISVCAAAMTVLIPLATWLNGY